jgi:hypothetical protein
MVLFNFFTAADNQFDFNEISSDIFDSNLNQDLSHLNFPSSSVVKAADTSCSRIFDEGEDGYVCVSERKSVCVYNCVRECEFESECRFVSVYVCV